MTPALLFYGMVTYFWFAVCFACWWDDRKDPSVTVADLHWDARATLLAPLWPLILLRLAGTLLIAGARKTTGVGSVIGDFMLDATRRSDD